MNNRKRQIIQACLTLFSKKGFNETSIQDILDAAKISKGTFYNYFPSKKECLIAILEISREEVNIRKVQAITGKERNDKSVLAVQLISSLQVNREQNLLPIFETIFQSGDKEMTRLVDQIFMKEINWTAHRLLDIYGMRLIPYHYDAAILLFGMIHQMLQTSKMIHLSKDNPVPIVEFAIEQLDMIVPGLIKNRKTMIGPYFEDYISEHIEQKNMEEDVILKQVTGFKSFLKESTAEQDEYLDYLIEELERPKPRMNILSAVAYQFYNCFRDTAHSSEAIEITNAIWQLKRQADDDLNKKEEPAKNKKC
ncbi:MAG TPA: TetR/AcrR family transcriptional regulator [Niallia sp.]|nr:TetR/AcrR family transcriptional regulator [Niallia sp.]